MRWAILPLVFALTAQLLAQAGGSQYSQEIRAAMKSGIGDRGKCTVEVEVDVTAEIEIFGDHAVIRTLAGQPSRFRHMECTAPMPLNPLEFRFKGIDGRGSQILVHDPRSNDGRALVRVEDPKSGRQGYTFDLTWRNAVDPRKFGRPSGGRETEYGPELEFNGKGDGYFRRNGASEHLGGVDVSIRAGDVKIMFFTATGARIYFTGRLIRNEWNHLTAAMSSSGVAGVTGGAAGKMIIDVDHERVRNIAMSGVGTGIGRNRFDVRWHD